MGDQNVSFLAATILDSLHSGGKNFVKISSPKHSRQMATRSFSYCSYTCDSRLSFPFGQKMCKWLALDSRWGQTRNVKKNAATRSCDKNRTYAFQPEERSASFTALSEVKLYYLFDQVSFARKQDTDKFLFPQSFLSNMIRCSYQCDHFYIDVYTNVTSFSVWNICGHEAKMQGCHSKITGRPCSEKGQWWPRLTSEVEHMPDGETDGGGRLCT